MWRFANLFINYFGLGTMPIVTVGNHCGCEGAREFRRRRNVPISRYHIHPNMDELISPGELTLTCETGNAVQPPTTNIRLNLRTAVSAIVLLALFTGSAFATNPPQLPDSPNRKDLVTAVKNLEKRLGFRRTHNFREESAQAAVAYRCYYTGKLELPESYSGLKLAAGTKDGCKLDTQKFDVFFYPMDANASGKTPLSATLAHEPTERLLVVVPHEDFHANKELRKLPETLAEASATLAGFLTAAEVARQQLGENSEVYQNLKREPELFARKAELVNQFHGGLSQLYTSVRSGQISERTALEQKRQAFDELRQACSAIVPAPKSFNRCPAAINNAGLAFDETYTKYYPLVYRLYLREGRELKPTLNALQRALNVKTEAEAIENLQRAVTSDE